LADNKAVSDVEAGWLIQAIAIIEKMLYYPPYAYY